jgi:hypothetical protein
MLQRLEAALYLCLLCLGVHLCRGRLNQRRRVVVFLEFGFLARNGESQLLDQAVLGVGLFLGSVCLGARWLGDRYDRSRVKPSPALVVAVGIGRGLRRVESTLLSTPGGAKGRRLDRLRDLLWALEESPAAMRVPFDQAAQQT